MTPPVGTPSGMEPFALDPGTAERLVAGAVDAGDAPPEYRAVARVLHALRSAPDDVDGVEWAGETEAVERIAAVVVRRPARTRRVRRTRRSSSRVARLAAAAAVAAAVCVTGGLASAGSLPEPAQNAASTVLGTVGISVPTGGEEPAGVQEPAITAPVPSPAVTPNSPDAGTSAPTSVAPPAPSSPAAPGNGNGVPAHGTPPSTAKGHGNGHAPNGSPTAGVGNGKSR